MNLKLSTSAALALDAINKAGGSTDAGDSKAILADKIASSYQQDVIAINGAVGKRMLQHVRKLQARMKKDDAARTSSATAAAEHEEKSTTIDHRLLPDVGILRRGMSSTSLKDSNRQHKPFRKVTKKSMDHNNPDVGILGMRKEGEQRRTSSRVGEMLPEIDPSLFEFNGTTPNVTEWYSEIYAMYPAITSTPTYLCGENGLGGTDPYSMSSSNPSTSPLENLPTCQCQPEQTSSCGPDLCTCLQNSQGDIKNCMDEVTTLCEGQDPTLTMGQCVGQEILSTTYCTYLPCIVDGGSYEKCFCDTLEQYCSTISNALYAAFLCPFADCCKTQTDDAGRATCFDGSGGFTSYYTYIDPYSGVSSALYEEFNECVSSPTTTAQCACDVYAPSLCRAYGDAYPVYCNIETCCQTQMDDAGRLDCWGNNAYCECMSGMGLGYNTRYKCLCQASSVRCEFGEQQQCEVYSCCVESSVNDDTKMKACLGIDNSTAVETVTCPYTGSTSSSESNLSTNDSNSSTKPSPSAIDTTTTEALPPLPPTTKPTAVLGTPVPSAAAELSISMIKTLTISVVSSVIGWLFMV